MIAYAIEATRCKALVTFIQRKINCEKRIHVLSSNFIQSSGHIKFIYAIMCTFLQEFMCEMAYSF